MRAYHKGWQNRRPGWTRRVKWYMPGSDNELIRLQFEDEFGKMNVYFHNSENATKLFEMFARDEIATPSLYQDMEMYEDELFGSVHSRSEGSDM